MPGDDPHRRYLIAVGITTGLPKSGPRIVESVNRMTSSLTDDFGYQRVTQLDIDPASDQIRKSIREFCLKCGPDDVVALYYTGHADEVNTTHRVWTGDSADPVSGTLETKHLAELMLAGTPLRYALIILDTCFAGQGGAEALLASVPSIGEGDGKTLALLTAAYPREQIRAGDFARLFERAVRQPEVAGHEPPYLSLGAIARQINKDKSRPGWQTVAENLLGARTDLLPFFPNRRFNRRLHGLDLLTQLRIEQEELRLDDLRGHFLPRARGVDVPTEADWRFVGRKAALRDVVSWLTSTGDRGSLVVTGRPGSGKSAVIGRLVVLSDPGWRRTVPQDDLAAGTIPPEGSIVAGIHARGLTTTQVLAALCAAVGVRADTPAELLRELRGCSCTVAVDAIDEALDPLGLVSGVLRPLAEAGRAEGLRLLLGTRPHLLDPLGLAGTAIDLDDDRYADPDSLREYVLRGLELGNPQSPYHAASDELVTAVARAVAAAAGHSFLVALIVARTLLSGPAVPDPADPAWRAGLPGTAAAAMHADLETRLRGDAGRARDLLRPLAFAHGAGLPWEDLWAPLASELSERRYTDDDLIWLRRNAGSYVVEAMESGHSVYRLYHAALAEYLRQGCEESRVHDQFASFLTDRVPAARTGPEWRRADPYTLAHLATHAQRAGRLDQLLLDPGYLVNAAPAGVLEALPAARDPDAELAGRAYQRASHQLRDQSEEDRLSYLELASRITRASRLAGRIAAAAPRRRWSVPWGHWPPEHPHRILAAHLGPVNGVICADPGDGSPLLAMSIGQDAMLRSWDAMTAEPAGAYAVGDAPLVAARAVRLPGPRAVVILLAADGRLHIWDMLTAARLRTVLVAPLWRRLARPRSGGLTLRCLGAPDGQQFAIVGGPGIRTSVWNLSSGQRVAAFPPWTPPASIDFSELPGGRNIISASSDGAVYWVGDLRTGQVLPDEAGRASRGWLREFYDRAARGSFIAYYARSDGSPAVAVRWSRQTATIWDLRDSRPLVTVPRTQADARVRLIDGRMVTVPVRRREFPAEPPAPGQDASADRLIPLRRSERPGPDSPGDPPPRFRTNGRFLTVELRDAASLPLAGHTAEVTGYDWITLPDGHLVVFTASRDGTVRRWDLSPLRPVSAEEEQPFVAPHRIVGGVDLDDGRRLGLTVADRGEIMLWDLRTGVRAGVLGEQPAQICAVSVAHPAGGNPVAVTFGVDYAARIWSLADGRQAAEFYGDPVSWPGDVACGRLSDGTLVAVTTGHGRKAVVWDLGTGRMRHVLAGHRGRSAVVTYAEIGGWGPLAVTGGMDNRVNVWDLRHGRRYRRFRIVRRRTFLAHPPAGRPNQVRAVPRDRGRLLVLVVAADGMLRALECRRFRPGARPVGMTPAHATGVVTLSDGQTVIVTALGDGIVRIWRPQGITRDGSGVPVCEINLEVPVDDVSPGEDDTVIFATPYGLIAIGLDVGSLRERSASWGEDDTGSS